MEPLPRLQWHIGRESQSFAADVLELASTAERMGIAAAHDLVAEICSHREAYASCDP
jgi:hypothetical protein